MSGHQSSEPATIKTDTPDDVNDFFSLDAEAPVTEKPETEKTETEKPVKPEEKEPEDEKTEDKEDDDIELKDEEPEDEEEKLEIEDKVEAPPRKKEILAKYPNLYKDFPFLEKMMYRDKQYNELFGSFEDAKEVHQKAQTLDEFERDILGGTTEKLFNSVKETDKKAWDKIVDDYLPTLHRIDKEAYFEVVGNIGRTMISQMAGEARRLGQENGSVLMDAAIILNQFLFGSKEYTPPTRRIEEKKDDTLDKEKTEFLAERFTIARDELQTKVNNVLRATISDHIDPKGEMSPYVKKNAIKDAIAQLHSMVGQDQIFKKNLDKLWEASYNSRFSQDSVNKIRSAYLGRSRQVLSSVIRKARAEALKDSTPSSRVRDEEDTPALKRGPISTGRPHHSSGKLKMEKGESVQDFLSRD